MRIQGPVLSESARPTTDRAQTVSELTLPTKGVGASVSLSGAARALAGALSRVLPEALRLHAISLLTDADRTQLAVLSEIVTAQGLEPQQLGNLTFDLAGYRLASLMRASALPPELEAMQRAANEPAVQPAPRPASSLLALPLVTPHDEGLARALLADLVVREPLFAGGFVQALLDPDAPAPRTVELAFVQRLTTLVTRPRFLGAEAEVGASEPDAMLQRALFRRDARTTLAGAVSALSLPRAELGLATEERVQRGALLLRARIGLALAEPHDRPWRVLTQLTRNDRALLGALYAANEARGEPPTRVDAIAHALVALRRAELIPSRAERAAFATGHSALPTPSHEVLTTAAPASEAHAHGTASRAPLDELALAPSSDGMRASARVSPRLATSRYGSATQIAMKAHGAYGSLRSDRPPQLSLGPARSLSESVLSSAGAPLDPTPTSPLATELRGVWPPGRPFDIMQALGLSGLSIAVQRRARRVRRRRRRAVRASEELLDAEDTSRATSVVATGQRIRRWESVIARRRRARQRTI